MCATACVCVWGEKNGVEKGDHSKKKMGEEKERGSLLADRAALT